MKPACHQLPSYTRHLATTMGLRPVCSRSLLLVFFLMKAAFAEELPEMEVSASRLVPDSAGASSPITTANRLRLLPDLNLKSQGLPDGQTDLQIRGGTFSGAGLAISGLALRNPQTEHFNAELPLSPGLFTAPRVLTGLEQLEYTDSYPDGAVALDFAPAEAHTALEAGGGEAGRNWAGFFLQQPLTPQEAETKNFVSAWGGTEKSDRTDGYDDNVLRRWNGGAHFQQRGTEQQTDLALARSEKTFGARGFYGAPAAYPSREAIEDTLALGSSRWQFKDGEDLRLTLSGRQLEDRYWLDSTRPWLYKNQHENLILAGNLEGRHQVVEDSVDFLWRLETGVEDLDSQYQGTLPGSGLGNHRRSHAGLLLLPQFTFGRLKLSAGARGQVFSGDRPALLPVAGGEYALTPGQAVYGNYTETVRQPSYTELNYDSPGSLGNLGLKRQHTSSTELGYRGDFGEQWSGKAAVFYQMSQHTVDWTRATAAPPWKATDLGVVKTWGAEVSGQYRPSPEWEFSGGGCLLTKASDFGGYASRYVLDYPEQRLHLGARWQVHPRCEFRIRQELVRQTSNAIRNSSEIGLEGTAECRIQLLPRYGAELVLAGENLWNSGFETYPGQPVAGRRFSCALTAAW